MAQAYYTPYVVATGQVPSTQTSFPALVYLSDTRFKTIGNGGHVVTGTDIRPYSDSGLSSALTYEMEFYDGTNGIWIGWVLISSLADAVTIYMGYGDSALNTDGSSNATWPSEFVFVGHMPNGSSLNCNDSTSNGNNGTATNGASAATGKADGGVQMVAASNQYVALGDPASLRITGAITIESWVNLATLPTSTSYQVVAKDKDTGGRAYTFDISVVSGNTVLRVYINGGANGYAYGATHFTTSTWYHCVGVFNPSTLIDVFVNGAEDSATIGTAAGASIPSATAIVAIGAREYAGFPDFMNGVQDEIRISNVARSTNWITTTYNNQNAPNTFWTKGTEVAVGGGVKVGSMFLMFQ